MNNKTNIRAYFSIESPDINPNIITDKLNIEPTRQLKRGEKIVGSNRIRELNNWVLDTGYEFSLDLKDVTDKIINILISEYSLSINIKLTFLLL